MIFNNQISNESAPSHGKARSAMDLVTTPTPPLNKDDDDVYLLAFDPPGKVR